MKIFIRGEKSRTDELRQKLHSFNAVTVMDDMTNVPVDLHVFDVIFDLNLDQHPEQLKYYSGLKGIPVLVSAVHKQLAVIANAVQAKVECKLFGLNALPTFINRSVAEVSLYDKHDEPVLAELMGVLDWIYKVVEDRVGMVTPRIVCMIINEACYTLQEGTASIRDIDTSMKLGTNYPLGPFEWADKMGIASVYETLAAVYEDTHDERYKICPLLKTQYLKKGTFY
jgi:3-hydroxybutyryl-CoA dehydrogenase